MGNEFAIQVQSLSKRYYRNKQVDTLVGSFKQMFKKNSKMPFWALDNINFEVKKGEAIGIIGNNGAGKSTLLKVLSRITPPTKGRAILNGKVTSLLEVGTGFHFELTGRENIYLNGSLLGMKRREITAKIEEIVEFSGVEKFIDTPVKKYSSGMYVRLAFSVAAHLDPDILLIDEVLAVGDSAFQKKCLGKMTDLTKDQNKTILIVSHNLSLIESFTDSIIILKEGKMVSEEEYFGNTTSQQKFDDGDLKSVSIVQVKKSLEITIEYDTKDLVFPNFSFVISNALGQNVFGGNTMYNHHEIPDDHRNGNLTISISQPVLSNGIYKLSYWFGVNKHEQPYKGINAISFEVNGMSTQTFNLNTTNYGPVVPKWDYHAKS